MLQYDLPPITDNAAAPDARIGIARAAGKGRRPKMSIYRVIRIIGTSPTSWEEATKGALEEAARHLEDLRVAEVEQLDVRLQDNKVIEYRSRVRASFRYHPEKGA